VNNFRLIARLERQDMWTGDHPGVVFRDGSSGRRAGLAGGPDIWEVIHVVREAGIEAAAEWGNVPPERVRTAVRYYADNPEEIDERIARHVEEARRVPS
jgi:hypothetical protein